MMQGWWRNRRGEWFVIGQVLLFALIGFGPARWPLTWPTWTPPGFSSWSMTPKPMVAIGLGVAGVVLILGGLGLIGAGLFYLGPNLTPLPYPKADGVLVERGAYGLVRHPIYSGLVLAAFGWACLRMGLLTGFYAALLLVFFDIKSRREERWLGEKFPAYAAYQRRVKKLIPGVY